jgi:AcrR family transcriptional regulator
VGQGISEGNGAGSRLPRGPHRLPREVVSEHQRQRLLAAAARALAEHGYAELTVEQILKRAGISRTTFYEHFENRRDCVLAAHEAAFDRLSAAVARPCGEESDWPRRLATAIGGAVDYATAAPEEALLLVPDAVGADPVLARRVAASTDSLVDLLRAGREHSAAAAGLPELTERALIGAATSVIGARLTTGQAGRLPELKPQLVELMLLPYVGPEEARRVATSRA